MENLPKELWDTIAEGLEGHADLLALGLTSKSWCKVIIPNHLETRVVRADAKRRVVWTYFAENSLAASRVHSLDIPRFPWKEIIPIRLLEASGIRFDVRSRNLSNTIKKTIPMLRQALAHMVNLRCLEVYYDPAMTDIFLMLAENPFNTLQELRVQMFCLDNTFYTQFAAFTGLLKVDIQIEVSDPNDPAPYLTPLLDMLLSKCPDLDDLCLDLSPGHSAPRFIMQGTWSKLKRLTLKTDMLTTNQPAHLRDSNRVGVDVGYETIWDPASTRSVRAQVMARFLARHPKLEVLKIFSSTAFMSDCITAHDAPSLKSFYLNYRYDDRGGKGLPEGVFPLSKLLPLEVAARLEYYEGWISAACLPLLSKMTSLKTCVPWLDEYNLLGPFLKAVPHLQRICYSISPAGLMTRESDILGYYGDFVSKSPSKSNLTHWARFPDDPYNISHWYYPRGRPAYILPAVEAFLRRISQMKDMKYVQIGSSEKGEDWVEIIRDMEGNYQGYQITNEVTLPKHWGKFYEIGHFPSMV
ncbi:hypothetical protein M422DRAFT_66388 [Sphaerobolus stellatus SS14]|uniref:F-box domain-containing protein n=1 Tax=Sphaerobolus stellatus (strain SS14) TaxID=990650 RepID=A0A0C9UWF9_SPHS4|nr:hypothetical protein M422DRAFT_66388 [Sphaerobolus stellatus SS14]